jgi:hypothetical protein
VQTRLPCCGERLCRRLRTSSWAQRATARAKLSGTAPLTRGAPAQVQSNALAALEALDARVAEEVLAEGCITGDRVNGLVDGASGKWCAAKRPRLEGQMCWSCFRVPVPLCVSD